MTWIPPTGLQESVEHFSTTGTVGWAKGSNGSPIMTQGGQGKGGQG